MNRIISLLMAMLVWLGRRVVFGSSCSGAVRFLLEDSCNMTCINGLFRGYVGSVGGYIEPQSKQYIAGE